MKFIKRFRKLYYHDTWEGRITQIACGILIGQSSYYLTRILGIHSFWLGILLCMIFLCGLIAFLNLAKEPIDNN